MSARRIRVLIVEDSPVIREFLLNAFSGDPHLEVAGAVSDGDEVLAAVRELRPDVVTMDIHMARMDGLEATRRVMQENPVPIVVVSGMIEDQVATTFNALEAGALAVVPRPAGLGDPAHQASVAELVRTLKLMSEVKLVRRRRARDSSSQAGAARQGFDAAPCGVNIVAIGASTGGPLAIQALLAGLPKDFTLPVLVVQHIAEGFLNGFVQWLTKATGFPVHLATDGEVVLPGHAYVAPDRHHMGVDRRARIVLSDAPPENGLRPSVDYLLRSARQVYGKGTAGVLLSGMGKDGAAELLALKKSGAPTFAQDRESSAVHGMPGEAIRLDAARYVLAPAEIAAALRGLAAVGVAKTGRERNQ